MVRETSDYYDQMSSTVAQALRDMWETEITLAESKRLRDPSVMDIIGVRKVQMNVQSDPTEVGRGRSDLQWLELALSMEERQLVLSVIFELRIN